MRERGFRIYKFADIRTDIHLTLNGYLSGVDPSPFAIRVVLTSYTFSFFFQMQVSCKAAVRRVGGVKRDSKHREALE